MNRLKRVYIAHPLRNDVEGNIKKATQICKALTEQGKVIPFSPLHAFNFLDPKGDQTIAMECCFALLASCDELWVHGDWQNSVGCLMEIDFAKENGIKIMWAVG
jgi:hypothetical protein